MMMPGPARRLFMMVWDGMRPDLVSPDLTPNLSALAARGVTFERSHAIVPTVTRCNAATLATGAPPAVHGLPGNMLFAPAVEPNGLISLGEDENVQRLRDAYSVFGPATVADVLADTGGNIAVVATGTRGSAQMLYPRLRERGGMMLHPTLSTDAELGLLVDRLGPVPAADVPDTVRNLWFTRAAAEIVIPEQKPDALLFWHGDPDKSQHRFGFGHPESLAAIRDADRHLGLVLDSLEMAGLRDETLVVVVSDHGYVGVRGRLDLAATLAQAGEDEGVLVAPNGCAALVYQPSGDTRALARLVSRFESVPEVGVMFSGARGAPILDGTFSLEGIGVDGPLAPDLLVTLRWSDDENENGYRGVSAEHGSTNLASHGGTSPYEIRNTMIVGGPGIRHGISTTEPVGNLDLAPTLVTLFGLGIPSTMTGRVLTEALSPTATARVDLTPAGCSHTYLEQIETRRGGVWLRWSEVAAHRYLDAAGVGPAEH